MIIGAGAIGTMLGVSLLNSGHDVIFYDRAMRIEKLKADGLTLVNNGIETHISNPQLIDNFDSQGRFDIAIVCIKAYHNESFVKSTPKDIFKYVMTIQNGVGNEEFLSDYFGKGRIISSAITLPVAVDASKVEITNKGGIAIAPIDENLNLDAFMQIFEGSKIKVSFLRDYRAMKWSKLILNIIANAVAAITGLSMSDIFQNRGLTKIEKTAVMETLAVIKKMGIRTVDLPGFPVKAVAAFLSTASPTFIELGVAIAGNKLSRGYKKPSLLLDLENGSVNSEVEFLNGAVYKKGLELGVDTKVNKFLYKTLSVIIKGSANVGFYRNNPDLLFKDCFAR